MTLESKHPSRMSRTELDDAFRNSEPGTVPVGRSRGTAMLAPGTAIEGVLRFLIRVLIWKGKIFRPETHDLKNRLSPFDVPGIRATVYQDTSWFDQAPAIIIDYSKTSFVARMVRDEIRQVAPGVYVGQIFLWSKRIGHFLLELPAGAGG